MLTTTLRRNAAGSAGLPVGVQIIGLPFEEEKILSLMNSLEEKINFKKYRKCPNINSE
jgi:Asp-tRNA(Asn)/Glu-tRNA(Gln) amidotransferase A subunit family amidase